jgi:hypothetical protein
VRSRKDSEKESEDKMKNIRMVLLLVALVVLAETGAVMVMLNARPHAPLGLWFWFGCAGVVAPIYALWAYRRYIGGKAD